MKTIFRIERPKRDFTILSNALLRDRRVSFKARGLHHLILSHSEDWEVTIEWLAKQSDEDGKKAVRTGIRELVKCGYARLAKEVRIINGRQIPVSVWTWFEEPQETRVPKGDLRVESAVLARSQKGPLRRTTGTELLNQSNYSKEEPVPPGGGDLFSEKLADAFGEPETAAERNSIQRHTPKPKAPANRGAKPADEFDLMVVEVYQVFNSVPEFEKAITTDRSRNADLKRRCKGDKTFRENWRKVIEKARQSDYHTGKTFHGYHFNFSDFLTPKKFLSVLEKTNMNWGANPKANGHHAPQPIGEASWEDLKYMNKADGEAHIRNNLQGKPRPLDFL